MSETKFTPGPWFEGFKHWGRSDVYVFDDASDSFINGKGVRYLATELLPADARLIAAAPTQNEEMRRYLPILERAEADPEIWTRLTEGTGIATLNGYRSALLLANTGGTDDR